MNSKPEPAMVRRVVAAQATLEQNRRKAFKLGTRDCVRMVAAHLRRFGRKVKLPPAGSYRSPTTALRRLQERGFATLAEAIDAQGLTRIPPAAAIVGDIVQIEAAHPLGALAVVLGNGRVVGYHEDLQGADVLQPLKIELAWRVDFA